MSSATQMTKAVTAVALAVFLIGCDDHKAASDAPAASSPPPAATTSAPAAPTSAPTASAAAIKPSHPCPEGSKGEGTFKKPCEGTGATRLMEVTWTGKMDDKGPSFRVTNKTKLEILYGYLVVYFYDKAGKQLEVPAADATGKARPKQTCGGKIFAGPMKAGEKAVLTFSCVKKKHVPEGTAFVEAEMQMVGFTGEDGEKADTFWRNKDLVPDERPKGGIK